MAIRAKRVEKRSGIHFGIVVAPSCEKKSIRKELLSGYRRMEGPVNLNRAAVCEYLPGMMGETGVRLCRLLNHYLHGSPQVEPYGYGNGEFTETLAARESTTVNDTFCTDYFIKEQCLYWLIPG